MIVCPNCNHQNPEGATQCEACYTPLPSTTSCPNCGATVQTDASFCGQCGFHLNVGANMEKGEKSGSNSTPEIPDLVSPDPLVEPIPMAMNTQVPDPASNPISSDDAESTTAMPATVVNRALNSEAFQPQNPDLETLPLPLPTVGNLGFSQEESSQNSPSPSIPETDLENPPPPPVPDRGSAQTQLQVISAQLLHMQTNTTIELPQHISVIHMGKPNDKIPPDIDVSGFPDSDIVSRIHADIRVEGDTYYIEDVGSSNGTYVNHTSLAPGNRHRLRTGDRISLGKGDKVTFLFQSS
ncbi:MAG: FHA domain-containing protein [Moorea sp. SIO1F2]|uniref:FHA domain-containing protein n=1 Tax=unclassified Moorena TaxID=2683338 RepID=UPI0013BE3E7B|nr:MULTISPECIES: FHA domain-containing protein [unclassified Moorena]NEO09855.1 FHA domain-containing protein [Moorena sp. SIO3I8]NEO20649.1 FHA domain-containing protein [Moorena sp. SIO4A5]NEP23691.1 FHA domain-containing protein [Moorena sp. SIO3I6]NEQ59085.1 FHA domain-containing protein [Moorena sp. SIO4A1]NET85331.1 FHA domain-containing protein [Moorena sp. SIO1F2]